MNNLKLLEVKGNEIAYEKTPDGRFMVNVTAFIKAFPNKNLTNIVKSKELREYLKALSDLQNCNWADLLLIKRGGIPGEQGTWADRRVALRIAQKLSPEFAVLVDMKIEELMFGGQKSVEQKTKYNEGQIFISKLGKEMIKGIYKNGELYYAMSKLLRYMGYSSSSGKQYAERFHGAIQIEDGNGFAWFVNLNWIEETLKSTTLNIPYEKISYIYRDLFGIEKNLEGGPAYSYRFTNDAMFNIFELIIKEDLSIQKKLLSLLLNGRIRNNDTV